MYAKHRNGIALSQESVLACTNFYRSSVVKWNSPTQLTHGSQDGTLYSPCPLRQFTQLHQKLGSEICSLVSDDFGRHSHPGKKLPTNTEPCLQSLWQRVLPTGTLKTYYDKLTNLGNFSSKVPMPLGLIQRIAGVDNKGIVLKGTLFSLALPPTIWQVEQPLM